MILNKILEFGVEQNYFSKKSISEIEKSCCSLSFEIIDYDETKATVCCEANQQTRKSCDGLYLKKSINFIEFKSLNNFFEQEFIYKLKQEEQIDEIEIIKEKIKDFNFKRKITDSLWLLDYIVRHKDLTLNNNEISEYESKEKNYYIVKDNFTFPLVDLVSNLNLLASDDNSLNYRCVMDIEIENMLKSLIKIEINRPKLINCDELENILKDLDE